MSPHLWDIFARARAGLWAGMSAERVMLEALDAAEDVLGPVDAGQENAMKVVVNAVVPGAPGAVDVHISLRDLKPGQEMGVAKAFSSIESAFQDGKITFFEGLSIAMALAAIGR